MQKRSMLTSRSSVCRLFDSCVLAVPVSLGCQRAKDAASSTSQRHDDFLCAERNLYEQRHCSGNGVCECVHHFHDMLHARVEAPSRKSFRF